jgi:type I restriction enzyme R subunit
LDQAKGYAACKRLHVPFVFSSNGHMFVEFDESTGITSAPRPIAEFPTPTELRARYEKHIGFSLTATSAKPLLQPYSGGEGTRRYYQDAAIRAVLEKIAQADISGEPKRALLSLATGDAAEVFKNADGNNNAKNARIHVATYQTLGVDREDSDASFLTTFDPRDYFTHIVIDECHRSAWGKWAEVLRRNVNAVQIGLTATPRGLAEALKRAEECQGVTDPWETQHLPDDLLLAAEKAPTYRVQGTKPSSPIELSREAKVDARISANNYE